MIPQRRLRVSGCAVTGRRGYDSKAEADTAMETIRANEIPVRRAYFCLFCHRWHLTTTEPQKFRRSRRGVT